MVANRVAVHIRMLVANVISKQKCIISAYTATPTRKTKAR